MTHKDDFPGVVGVREQEIGYTAKLKVYPDGSTAITAAEKPIFRPPGWEARKSDRKSPINGTDESDPTTHPNREDWEKAQSRAASSLARSKRRALTSVRDYALSNDFRYFVTLTLDRERIDRYDYEKIIRAMRVWCDNQVRRKGLKYILVPELHKDGALHFHGFFPEGVEIADSGTMIPPEGGKPRKPRSRAQCESWLSGGGHLVYNLPDWKFGYSTAIALYGSYHAAVAYVCKYISKAEGKTGGRWYFSGGKLKKPEIQYSDISMAEVMESETAAEYEVREIGLKLAYDFTALKGERHDQETGKGSRTGAFQAGYEWRLEGNSMALVQQASERLAHGTGSAPAEERRGEQFIQRIVDGWEGT